MKSFAIFSVTVLSLALSEAHIGSFQYKQMKPSHAIPPAYRDQIPSADDISIAMMENMPVDKGVEIMEHFYHINQINHTVRPNFVPSPSHIPCYVFTPNGHNASTTFDKLAASCKKAPHFGHHEVTIYITGYPAEIAAVAKANQHIIEAYQQRYHNNKPHQSKPDYSEEKVGHSSSEEDASISIHHDMPAGNFIMIDMGSQMHDFKRIAHLDTEQSGAMIAFAIMEVIQKCAIPEEIIHIVAQGVAAHVAGAAGRKYSRHTGRHFRRITALDPSKMYARDPQILAGLSRGDAEFVDAIHTNVYGFGTIHRVGDVDFFPNGISKAMPGTKNIMDSSMRATHYFAETVHPGNERNFPAVAANSFKEYKNSNGHGKRVHMGIDTDYDVKGDYIMEVNEKSPFGKRAPVRKQSSQYEMHSK